MILPPLRREVILLPYADLKLINKYLVADKICAGHWCGWEEYHLRTLLGGWAREGSK